MRTPSMRLNALPAVALAVILVCAHHAAAFELRLVPTTSTTIAIGEPVSFDLFLDTQGESGIWAFQVGLGYEPSAFDYAPELSGAASYVLYSPGGGVGNPDVWLESDVSDFCCDPPPIWAGTGPPNVATGFVSSRILEDVVTRATATNAYLSTMTFTATREGSFMFDIGLQFAGNAFVIGSGDPLMLEDIEDQVATVGDTLVTVIPEPSTAALLGAGLFAIARSRPRRRSGP